jgi:hypothetical protein
MHQLAARGARSSFVEAHAHAHAHDVMMMIPIRDTLSTLLYIVIVIDIAPPGLFSAGKHVNNRHCRYLTETYRRQQHMAVSSNE